jgi:diguanylate cyclase
MLNTLLRDHTRQIASDTTERYRFSFSQLPEQAYLDYERHIEQVLDATLNRDIEDLTRSCRELVRINSTHNVPYVVLVSELNGIKNRLTSKLLAGDAKDEVFEVQKVYEDIENIVAREYLGCYMEALVHANNIRIGSLKDLMKKNLIVHYEGHLEWLNDLTRAISTEAPETIPQLDASLCVFGKWLQKEGKSVISNNSKYDYIVSIHETLHGLAKAIRTQMEKTQMHYSVMMSYLEKCEFISLSIGTELALIDNRQLVRESTKDKMTGALSRNVLDSVFFNQYELALATDSTFVMAMCDLDHFKQINDRYGHTTGDRILKEFVALCHHTLRESDIVVRYGGEEFIILMSNTHLKAGAEKLEALRCHVENLCCGNGEDFIDVSVSIGAIEIRPEASGDAAQKSLKVYLEEVDALLYRAKAGGRNRVLS